MKHILILILTFWTLVSNARPPETGWYEFTNPFDFDELLFEKDLLEVIKQKKIKRMTIGITDYFFTENRVDSIIRNSKEDENWKITYEYDEHNRIVIRDSKYFYLNDRNIDSIFYDSDGYIASVSSWWINYKDKRLKKIVNKNQEIALVTIENTKQSITYSDRLNHNTYVYDKALERFTASKRRIQTIYGKTVIDSISYSKDKTQYYYKYSDKELFILGQENIFNEQGKVIRELNYQADSDKVKYRVDYYYNVGYKLIRKDSFKYDNLEYSDSYFYMGSSGLLDCFVEIYPNFIDNEEIFKSEIHSCTYN